MTSTFVRVFTLVMYGILHSIHYMPAARIAFVKCVVLFLIQARRVSLDGVTLLADKVNSVLYSGIYFGIYFVVASGGSGASVHPSHFSMTCHYHT